MIHEIRRHTLLSRDKLEAIQHRAATLSVPGDLAEFGVYRGGVSKLLAKSQPSRRVYLFDTFCGLPSTLIDDAVDWHKPGEFAVGLIEVQSFLRDCPNVVYCPGLFPDTTEDLGRVEFALVHIDADLYQSTIDALRYFWPRLSNMGSLVLDDWKWQFCKGVEKAVNEYFGDNPPTALMDDSIPQQLTITKIE